MSDERFDLLETMSRLVGNTRTMAGLSGDPRLRDNLRDGEKARVIVEELIDAVRHAREALAESKSDPLTVGKLTRVLARVRSS